VDISRYIITDLGIEKGHHFNLTDEQVEAACAAAKKSCSLRVGCRPDTGTVW